MLDDILNDHSRYNRYIIENGLRIDKSASVKPFLLERDLRTALAEELMEYNTVEFAHSIGCYKHHLQDAIDDLTDMDSETQEIAKVLYDREGFAECMRFLTSKYLRNGIEDFDPNQNDY